MNPIKNLPYFLVLVVTVLIFYSIITNTRSVQTTSSGIEVNYFKKGEGKNLEDGEIIIFNLVYKDHEGTELLRKVGDDPVVLMKDSTWEYNGIIYEVINLLKKGDSVTFDISTEDFYANSPSAGSIPDSIKLKPLTFYCGITEIMNKDEFQEYQKNQFEKMQSEMNKQNENQLSVDLEILDNYLKSNNIDAIKTESGLRYVITEKGDGNKPSVGSKVIVHYNGTLLEGQKFDSSYDRGEPFSFELGVGMVIPGWDEGIGYLSKGAKGTLYIPSPLAYGPNGAGGVIPGNAILIFEVELIDFE